MAKPIEQRYVGGNEGVSEVVRIGRFSSDQTIAECATSILATGSV
jgi:hypothetical protein